MYYAMIDFVYYTRHLGYLSLSVIKKHLYELQKFRQQQWVFWILKGRSERTPKGCYLVLYGVSYRAVLQEIGNLHYSIRE